MKTFSKWLLLGLLLAAFLAGGLSTPAAAADPVTLEVFNPSGGKQITYTFAPRLDTLDGKTICEVATYDNEWQSYRTFAVISDFIKKQYPTAKILDYNNFPNWREDATIGKQLKAKGCQAVIVGNAG